SFALPANCHGGYRNRRTRGTTTGAWERRGTEVLRRAAEASACGHGSNRLRAMVRADASPAGIRALDRGCSRDSSGDGAEAEDGCAGCSAYSRSAAGESLPTDLDSLAGGARSATTIAPSPQNGLPANFGAKAVASASHGPGRLPQKEDVGSNRTDRTRRSGVRSLGGSPTAGAAADTRSAGSFPDGVGSSGRERSRATPCRPLLDGTTRGGSGDTLDVCADDGAGGALPPEQAGGELSRAESAGE